MEFSLVDAERQLSEQAYLKHEFGGVVATSVIHAARHLVATTFIVSTLLRVIGVAVFVLGVLMMECWSGALLHASPGSCVAVAEGMDHVESVPLYNNSPLPPPPRLACASG